MVAVGLTLVEPLADVEVNDPGVMLMVVAPLVDQLSVTLAPDVMVVVFAPKDAMVGAEPGGGMGVWLMPAQPTRAAETRSSRADESEPRQKDWELVRGE